MRIAGMSPALALRKVFLRHSSHALRMPGASHHLCLLPPFSQPSATFFQSQYTTVPAGNPAPAGNHLAGAQPPRQQAQASQRRTVAQATGSRRSGSAALEYDALLVDVGGTLLETSKPVPRIYAQFGEKHGVVVSEDKIKAGFREAFSKPWPKPLRYEGSGEEFWRYAVATAMGCDNEALFQDLYSHFSRGDAWRVADGAVEALQQLRDAGVKLGVVSNFDTRLRPILRDLQVDSLFDSITVSCEVLHEKPAPEIFQAALDDLSLRDASQVVHLGDEALNDFEGAKRMGMEAWLWKRDVSTFQQVAERLLGHVTA